MTKRKKLVTRGRRLEQWAQDDINELLGIQPARKEFLIEYLHLIQDYYGQISMPHLHALADRLRLSPTEAFEVASFYHHFDLVEADTIAPALTIRVCDSITCHLFGADELISCLEQSLAGKARIQRVPCVGRCAQAPVAVVGQFPVGQATAESVLWAIDQGMTQDAVADAILLDSYLASGGYATYQACLQGARDAESIISTLQDSNLRGLGGAGFPMGRKWRIVREQPAPRNMAVNIDEGEPGTFKDRHYLERDPHRFLEGMLIAAHVVGIASITLYIRDEYTALRQLLLQELASVQERFGAALPPINLRRGAGSYICGEESAMIESIEGKRGMPRLRPPYVAQVGLFGRPTLEHNMESLYWVRDILEHGAAWFTGNGRHGRTGLRSFSVSGRVRKPGVHLAPAGITINELITEYCGGMLPGHAFKAYFPGGASGGILPAEKGDIPLDFDTLNEHGCFIGSAAIIVLSDQDSVRQSAINAMQFFADESCGQCTPCRVGTQKAVTLMQQPEWDIELMQELSSVMCDASICGLGQAAPNPLECIIRYFPQEIKPLGGDEPA